MKQVFHGDNEKNKERADKIVAAIQEYGELITGREIKELVGDKSTVSAFKTFMSHYVAPNYPEIEAIPRKGYIYRGIKKEEKTDKELYKNSEGYLDPTAGKALANLMMSAKVKKTETNLVPGEVWTRSTGSYSGNKEELALILGESSYAINYIPVRDSVLDKDFFYADYCIKFEYSGKKYFVDWRQIKTCGENPFASRNGGKYMFLLSDDIFEEIKQHIAKRFDIQQTVKEVIKEKKVEVPVYEVKEVPAKITREDAIKFLTEDGYFDEEKPSIDLAVWKAKAIAWENAFRLMCGKEG